jgi:hypothetical protein
MSPPDLLIVARDRVELYAYLVNEFAGDADVTVVIDRRHGERRGVEQPAGGERRNGDRRSRPLSEEQLRTLGFVVVPID